MNKLFSAAALAAMLSIASLAQADIGGLLNGRSADLTKLSDMSVEGGFITGDDYDHYGVRLNYRINPGAVAYGDLGQTEINNSDGTSFGVGLFYQLEGLFANADTAIKGSYHSAKLGSGRNKETVSAITVDLIASGREPLSDNGMEWYGQIGFNRLKGDAGSDTELGFGGGLILPVSAGEVYFGVEHIDELFFGIGFRYNL